MWTNGVIYYESKCIFTLGMSGELFLI
jgi:hypothetical protein